MANSCLSTAAITAHLPCGAKLPDAAAALQPLRVSFPRRPTPRRLLFDRLLPAPLRRRGPPGAAVVATASQEEAAATAAVEEEEEEGREQADTSSNVEAAGDGEEEGGGGGGEEAEPSGTKLYFGNLPYNCDSSLLAGVVSEYASPEMVEVLYDRETGRSRGFAFVTMSTIKDCETVIENLDGSQYGGRTMKVNFADKPKSKETPLYPETEFKLFVGNLSWTVDGEALTEAFRRCGNVVGARVLYDGDTGRSRGYGFVCYSSKEEMVAALDVLHGLELQGRAIRVSLAVGKK